MWDYMETISPTIRRSDSATWYNSGFGDPWPHASRDMMKFHQAGWVFGELREALATRVFTPLYGTRELHSSKDGFCLHRPTLKPVRRRLIDHFDQGSQKQGLHCIQASVALLDQQVDDGCFMCWPRSHHHHAELTAGSVGARDWFMLTKTDRSKLKAFGCAPHRIPVNRGDVILWRSDLVHAGADPVGVRPSFRAVVYVCMMPSQMTPEALYPKKRLAYEKLETGSHWPTKEEWFRREGWFSYNFKARCFFKSPPQLTNRLQELYGLRHYPRSG